MNIPTWVFVVFIIAVVRLFWWHMIIDLINACIKDSFKEKLFDRYGYTLEYLHYQHPTPVWKQLPRKSVIQHSRKRWWFFIIQNSYPKNTF